MTPRALMIQLARLGDLVQSLPAIGSLTFRYPQRSLDLLCPAPFASLARLFSGVGHVLEWNGPQWHAWAESCVGEFQVGYLDVVGQYLAGLTSEPYETAYVLNQHRRALLAGSLLASQVRGPYLHGPLNEELSPWASYLRHVARSRGANRIHLSDAFCGLCGLIPPPIPPRLTPPYPGLPADLGDIGSSNRRWLAVVVGAGDSDRIIPESVWIEWISALLARESSYAVVLVGSERERERSLAIKNGLPPMMARHLWDATGRTNLPQLAALLKQCQWAVGGDTGPLHLATAVGTRAMGFYFSRARVHETGPYGNGHWVWQADPVLPETWPIHSSVALLLDPAAASQQEPVAGWSLWQSHHDEWGAIFRPAGDRDPQEDLRATVWHQLSEQSLSLQGTQ